MGQPHLKLAPGGAYIVQLSPGERWLVQSNVEPFRSESRALRARAFSDLDGHVPLRRDVLAVREDLIQLEDLSMAWRMV